MTNDIHARDDQGMTPLHNAAYKGKTELVKSLLAQGADVYAVSDDGSTVLHFAKNIEIIKIFLEAGVDINARDDLGRTPLHNAAYKGKTEEVKFLLDQGAVVHAVSKNGSTVLHSTHNVDIAKMFLAKGVNINAKNDNGHTPLSSLLFDAGMAFDEDFGILAEQARFYIENGAIVTNVESGSGQWNTTLHLAAELQTAEIFMLIANKAPQLLTVKNGREGDNFRYTPLELTPNYSWGKEVHNIYNKAFLATIPETDTYNEVSLAGISEE